jgi:hypothetical protein
VHRGLAAFLLASLGLVAASTACSGPEISASTQSTPEAQATNVRRTAVAEVQRIIANNSAPTSTPAPTALPRPTCKDAIWWHEARAHLGETRRIQGPVVAVRPAPDTAVLIEIGQPYPDPTGFAIVAPPAAAGTLAGQSVCVSGKIMKVEGVPTITVSDASAIVRVEGRS